MYDGLPYDTDPDISHMFKCPPRRPGETEDDYQKRYAASVIDHINDLFFRMREALIVMEGKKMYLRLGFRTMEDYMHSKGLEWPKVTGIDPKVR